MKGDMLCEKKKEKFDKVGQDKSTNASEIFF